jgi:amidase
VREVLVTEHDTCPSRAPSSAAPGLVGLPATAVPLALSTEGLPIGAQIIGPAFADPVCLRFAQWLEREYRAFVPPPLALSA